MKEPRGPRTLPEMVSRLLHQRGANGWELVFGTPDRVREWSVFCYEYVDDLDWMPPAAELLRVWPLGDQLLDQVGWRLRTIGWDGEGVFQIFWLPPFLGVGIRDIGCYGLLVKQNEDGIAWIASPVPLPMVEAHAWDTHPIYDRFKQRAIADGRLRQD